MMSEIAGPNEISSLIDDYHRWLKDKTILRRIGDWTEITTPFLDHNNDMLQVYASKSGGEYVLTDDGATLNELESSGCSFDSPRRKELLQITLNGFGIKQEGNALVARA